MWLYAFLILSLPQPAYVLYKLIKVMARSKRTLNINCCQYKHSFSVLCMPGPLAAEYILFKHFCIFFCKNLTFTKLYISLGGMQFSKACMFVYCSSFSFLLYHRFFQTFYYFPLPSLFLHLFSVTANLFTSLACKLFPSLPLKRSFI